MGRKLKFGKYKINQEYAFAGGVIVVALIVFLLVMFPQFRAAVLPFST